MIELRPLEKIRIQLFAASPATVPVSMLGGSRLKWASESKGKDGKKEEEEDEEETEDGEEEEAMNMRGTVSSKRGPNTTVSVVGK